MLFSVAAACMEELCNSCITTKGSAAENTISLATSGSFEAFSVPALASLVGVSALLGSSSSMMLTVTVPCLSTLSTTTFSLGEGSLTISPSCAMSVSTAIFSLGHPVVMAESFPDTLTLRFVSTLVGLLLLTSLRLLALD